MSPLLIAILLLIVVYKFYEFLTCVPPNAPPCLPRLPIVGSYWHLLWGNYNYPYKTFPYYVRKLRSKILTCYFGPFFSIVANDYTTIKEILTRDEFDGRPTEIDVLKDRAFGKSLGIFFTEGTLWHQQRRYSLRHTRDFGFGRRHEKFESVVMEEISVLMDMLKEGPINNREKEFLQNGRALFPDVLYPYVGNTIWYIMFGNRFDRSEHQMMRELCLASMMFQRSADTTGGAIFQFWFLKYFGNMFGYKNIMKGNRRIIQIIKEHLKYQKQSHSSDSDRGLIDRYVSELKKENAVSTFSEEQLIMILVDFIFPAVTAIPSVVTHAIKLVMHNPTVLKNIQEEIDRVVGAGRYVTWEDRKNLPYTEATMREALRYETLTPLSVLHKTLKDTTLCGYDIPKNTLVITNLSGLNSDPDLWGDPENFRPERFLNENGELGKDYTFAFGLGHRVCAGETFARYNLFELFAALVQNFTFSFVEGQPTSLDDKLPGLIVTPKETWIGIKLRR